MKNTVKPAPGSPAWQIETLAESAKHLAKNGDISGAEKIYEKILEVAPYHVRSLNALAARAMERGDIKRAKTLIERAIQVAPDRFILHENFGHILNALDEKELALTSFIKAAELRPNFVYPLICQAMTLESMGRLEEAAIVYARIVKLAPDPNVVAMDDLIPARKRPLVLKAIASFRQIMYQFLHDALREPIAEFGGPALQRVVECAKIKSGISKPVYQHALQHPDWLYVPGIKPHAFFDPSEFEWVTEFQSHTSQVKNELVTLLESKAQLEPYVKIEGKGDKQQWTTLNYSAAWSSYHFLKASGPITENCERCPATIAALQHIPLVQITQHAPEVFFSILQPGTHIPPHHGLGNYKLAVHLPLLIPDKCRIRVGHETRGWSEGQCMIFDDSFQHEAWNDSEHIRAVLIMEIWNPELSEAERIGVQKIVEGINAFNEKYGL
ncbi:MAG: aspartyl/asparaginyl beta-hydroxylase domain-containing protein [Candidatus Saccharimonadales bacterium]